MTELSADEVRARRFDVARKGYDRAASMRSGIRPLPRSRPWNSASLTSRRCWPRSASKSPRILLRRWMRSGRPSPESWRRLGRPQKGCGAVLRPTRRVGGRKPRRAAKPLREMRRRLPKLPGARVGDRDRHAGRCRRGAGLDSSRRRARTALFIRAEAEREALRLTGDARRDRGGTPTGGPPRRRAIGRNRSPRERHAARIGSSAGRGRPGTGPGAFEQRRAELMEELEAARASIGELEAESDARRTEVEEASEDVSAADEAPDRWPGEDSSVRIVAADRIVVAEPVDALQLAAEVEELRQQSSGVQPVSEPVPEPEPIPEPTPRPATGAPARAGPGARAWPGAGLGTRADSGAHARAATGAPARAGPGARAWPGAGLRTRADSGTRARARLGGRGGPGANPRVRRPVGRAVRQSPPAGGT